MLPAEEFEVHAQGFGAWALRCGVWVVRFGFVVRLRSRLRLRVRDVWSGSRAYGFGSGVKSLVFGVWCLGCGVWVLGFGFWGLGVGVWSFGLEVWILRSGV